MNGLAGISLTIAGDTATINIPGSGSVNATRVTGASSIVGAWGFSSTGPDNSVVVVFLPNGVYFMAQDGDSTAATGDPSGHDGIEHGTYSWNPATGVLTSSTTPAPYVDTNGEWDLSDSDGTVRVSPDLQTLTVEDSEGSISVPRIAAASGSPIVPIAGVWWNPNESGSRIGLDYQNGTLIAEVYSYLAGGASQWYLAAGPVTNNVFTATLDKHTGGQCISCAYKAPALAGNDGNVTIIFTSPTTADITLPGGRAGHIRR